MKKEILAFVSISLSILGFAQNTLTLQPDATDGKDATIWHLRDQSRSWGPSSDTPNGTDASFIAQEWTWYGNVGRRKGLIDFDLSSLPANSVITKAELSLYAYPNSADGGHSTLAGSNECTLQQITSDWDENTVTWNTQPTVTTVNSVTLSASLTENQNYLDIDVTKMIQEQYAHPNSNYGMMLSMDREAYHRAMIFGSSDHPNSELHPKLVITYNIVSDVSE